MEGAERDRNQAERISFWWLTLAEKVHWVHSKPYQIKQFGRIDGYPCRKKETQLKTTLAGVAFSSVSLTKTSSPPIAKNDMVLAEQEKGAPPYVNPISIPLANLE